MKISINGIVRDMTPAELAAMQAEQERAEAEEKHRSLTQEEVTAMLLRQQINTLAVDDATAYRMREFYPEWKVDEAYTAANGCPVGYKVVRQGKLYKLRTEHTSQDNWEPGAVGTESLWEEICEQHDGTKYDPILYSGNMALESGKYYSQDGVTYKCIRDTGNPVYSALSELVGIYVEIVEATA